MKAKENAVTWTALDPVGGINGGGAAAPYKPLKLSQLCGVRVDAS